MESKQAVHFVHCSSQCLELRVGSPGIVVELTHELANVGMKSNFVGWGGETRHLGIP